MYAINTKDIRKTGIVRLCLFLLQITVNPPFSLIKEYIAQLMEYEKKFLIIAPQNAISYKEIFPLLMQDKMWLGYGFNHGDAYFRVPPENAGDYAVGVYNAETGLVHFRNCCWFTNLDIQKRHTPMDLRGNYYKGHEDEYPHYDNYDAIEVNKIANIPIDYYGNMGVPVTFLDKYCPSQFEIIGMCENMDLYGLKTRVYTSAECKQRYFELFGKKGTYDLNASGVINGKKVYQRLIIRRRKENTYP